MNIVIIAICSALIGICVYFSSEIKRLEALMERRYACYEYQLLHLNEKVHEQEGRMI